MSVPFQPPRVLAWEVTRRCPLACKHCRAGAANIRYEHELTTEECRRVIDSLERTMIIWTGGEPMLRPDILELVSYATSRQLRSVMAPCGMLVTEERLAALKAAGVMACSFSLDGPDAASHDAFRGVAGEDRLDAIYDRAVELGASKLDLFFLVPVGRGKGIADYALSDAQTRQVLDWAFAKAKAGPLAVKETCCPSAPVYWTARGGEIACGPRPCGCLGGRGFAFLSHVGDLQTCGFIDVPCGNIRDFNCDFRALAATAVNPLGAHGTCRRR